MGREKRCPCCDIVVLPRYRALCAFCFPSVPAGLRSDFIKAWHLRTRNPRQYREELARLLTWRTETRAGMDRKDGAW